MPFEVYVFIGKSCVEDFEPAQLLKSYHKNIKF